MGGAMVEQADARDGIDAPDRVRAFESLFASEAAFREFYERVLPRIYGYLLPRCGADRTLAEELTQQTYTAAVRERRSFDGRSDPIVWLTGIARHKLADHYRRTATEERSRQRQVIREIELAGEGRAWRVSDERDAIVQALAGLPVTYRAVLVLHYADGFSIREVATMLGRSEKSVEGLMSRARDAFRDSYGEIDHG
jgi:RNA polymerase sigma-70 factor (ECF subfamily)